MYKIIGILIIALTLFSCSSVRHTIETVKEVPITKTKIQYRDRVVHDSIYTKDSIFVYIKADTVYKYVERLSTQYIFKNDTAYIYDTIQVPVTLKETISEIKEVNVLYLWQRILMYIGEGTILAILIYMWFKLKKFI